MHLTDVAFAKSRSAQLANMKSDRLPYWNLWRDLADAYLPRRYTWLLSEAERAQRTYKNPFILDGTGTNAARILASGMMNGITSPTRPWFKLRAQGDGGETINARRWLDEVARRMLAVMAESNFYNSMAVLYMDLAVFGTAASLIYEDRESVIRCYNPPLGEYYLAPSFRGNVDTFGREFKMPLRNIVQQFGIENCSDQMKMDYARVDANHYAQHIVQHLIEPNDDKKFRELPKHFKFRELYWLPSEIDKGCVLGISGFNEMPGMFPRWDANPLEAYGGSPGQDAYGDVVQLQHDTKRKGQGLDFMVRPPIVADIQLEHKPTALMPGGFTYVSNLNASPGAKPLYTVNPPIAEISQDLQLTQGRIREHFHNPLFNMISQLNTVRSAAEIDARREEKLVLLGPVLERFENEALDPAIDRVFGIMSRKGLLPPPPEELAGIQIEVQYVSFLSIAQKAIATAPTERWLAIIGQIAPLYQGAMDLPNFDNLLLGYARDIGVNAEGINSPEEINTSRQGRNAPQEAAGAAAIGGQVATAAKELSQAEVGGGRSVLNALIGN